MKPNPSLRDRRVSSAASSDAARRSWSSRWICVSFAWACFAFVFLYRNRCTKRSRRAMSAAIRSAVFAA